MLTTRTARQRGRAAALTSAALAGVLALAACGSTGEDAPAAGGGDATEGGGDGESATLTVWHYFSADNQVALMDEYADMFESANPGVTVENVFVPYDQMNSKLVSAAGSQTGPDVAVFNGAEASTIVLGGALAPIDEYLDGYEAIDQLPDSVIHTINDSRYAVQGYVNLLGLWYNADILAEIGVEPPTTLDELESAMAAAKEAGYQGITLSGLPNSQGEWQAYPWLTAEGFDYENLDADAMAAGLARVRGWVENGWLSQEAVNWDQTVPFQTFASGGVAFAENGNWQLGTAEADADFEFGVVPLPLGDEAGVYLGGEGQGIGAFSENKDLAWKYLAETYLSVEGQVLAADLVGSIPSRIDAAQEDVVTGNEMLQPFADSIQMYGANYPASHIPPEAVADLQLNVGQAWSAALGGQTAPEQAAQGVVATLEGLLD